MRRTTIHLVLIGAAALGFAGCSNRTERQVRDAYRDVFNRHEEGQRVELNTASRKQLARLPSLSDDDAARIVANRPYPNKRALLERGIIGERKFEQIQDYVYVDRAHRDRD